LPFGRPARSYCAVDLGLGQAPATARVFVTAQDINNLGQITGSFAVVQINDGGSLESLEVQAYVWDLREGMRLLGTLPGTDTSNGEAITAFGAVIGNSFGSFPFTVSAFISDRSHDLRPVDTLLTPGGRGQAADINRRGQIAGFSSIAGGAIHAFLRDPDGEVLDLDPFGPASSSFVNALNDLGQVVGFRNPPGQISQGFLWDRENGMQPLLGSSENVILNPIDINNRGQIAVFLDEPLNRAARWTQSEGLLEIGSLGDPAGTARPTDINEWGVIVGSSTTSQLAGHPFLWTEATGMLDLNDRVNRSAASAQNIELRVAKAINEFGWIAAEGIDIREIEAGRNISHTYLLIPQVAGLPRCR
jgi:probable HAF family extracellular repeat protein